MHSAYRKLQPRLERTPLQAALQWIAVLLTCLAIALSACDPLPASLAATATPTQQATTPAQPVPSETPFPLGTAEPVQVPALQLQKVDTQAAWIQEQLAVMDLSARAGQVILTGIAGSEADSATCQHIQGIKPAGIFLTDRNVSDSEQLRSLTSALQECAKQAGSIPLLVSLAHEGQPLNHFEGGMTIFPSALAIGASGDPENAYQVAFASGQELAYTGVNMLLGPVADVQTNLENRLFDLRTFGGNAQEVQAYVGRSVQGYAQAGVIPALKHFPGHGETDVRYALQVLPVDPVGATALAQDYLPPFWTGLQAGGPVVVLGHVVYPRITGTMEAASLSPKIVELLRQQAGFEGVLMTDALLSTEGVTGPDRSVAQAGVQAIQAGLDLLFVAQADQAVETQQAIVAAVQSGNLPADRLEQAVARILAVKLEWRLSSFPLPQGKAPDWQANAEMAARISSQAVTLYRDEAGLLPLSPQAHKVLVIGPDASWSFYSRLQAALEARGHGVKVVNYSPPWEGTVQERELIQELPGQANNFDQVIYLTWNAHLDAAGQKDEWQARVGKQLSRSDTPTIFVALASPGDILEYPKAGTYLATFGATDGQMQALIDVLSGTITPSGVNPLPEMAN